MAIHLLAECQKCQNTGILQNQKELAAALRTIIEKNCLHIVGTAFHTFPYPGGITCVFLLAESHLSLHTWPERDNLVHLDIFACNKNQEEIEQIFTQVTSLLRPSTSTKKVVMR